jgi:hypothetical protein
MREHQHKFQMEGNTWACFGHPDACGLRAPVCFTPKAEHVTDAGMLDLVLFEVYGG